MRRILYLLVTLLALTALTLVLFVFIIPYAQKMTSVDEYDSAHILGGFSADTPDRATRAAEDGIRVVFKYGDPPAEDSALGQKLLSLHMRVVDGFIASYLHFYECHRTSAEASLVAWTQYCQKDYYPSLTSEDGLLALIAAHLRQVKDNPLVIGYWVLDDWASWDAGGARDVLIRIHALIQQYTPDRPTICGFGGGYIGTGASYRWGDWLAENFSPQGCDRVGLYLYASSLPSTPGALFSDTYNWSMTGLLPAIFHSLEKRGWNIAKEPLIGIGQAFGGAMSKTGGYWVTPRAQDIEMQSRSFCAHGATGLAFYGWDDSGFSPETHTPMTSREIEVGIHNGIAACKRYWA